ncbi:Hypothetical predicted protein [Olea europaea subsp. europaea]|uniref:Uncharacterized protein n=1 Tax=Olea europaea subsp. europaea TaxID=158383 RepID=A0A8S0QAW7_OLEEU|nr:Hypothetical predicted protein [Olea europaea subsp. europaea]
MYYARLPVNGLPRMCRWKSTLTPNSHDIAEVLDNPQKRRSNLGCYLYEDGGYPDVDDAVLDDDLDPPQSQREKVSPNIREDDVCAKFRSARVQQHTVPTSRRPSRSRRAFRDHGDMLKQLLHHVERLSDKYEEINRKVDTIMNWMRPSQHLNREHSFEVDGVFEIEGNNHEEVESEMDGGDIMEENGAWDAVGEFEARSAVMETLVGGIESEAEMREIGKEAVAGGIEMEVEAVGAVIETVLGNIEREMDVVDNDVRINERTRMYTKTTGAKWRRHVDSMSVDLFRDVDPVKKKHLSKWHSNLGDSVSYELGHINLEDAKKWFNDVLKPGGCFLDEHVDMALHLLRARATKYSKSFGGSRAVLDVQFNNLLTFTMLDLRERRDHFRIPVELMEHWLAIEVDFYKATICVYDPDKGCITNDQLKDDLKAASIIVPLLLKEFNIDLETGTLAIERSTKTTKQAIL